MHSLFTATSDEALKAALGTYSLQDTDYWSFRHKAVREHAHALFQYPAMMVPKMLGELIRVFIARAGNIASLCDPFVGSGTTMTEAMLCGLDVYAQDINPLAYLLCNVKRGPFYKSLPEKANILKHRIRRSHGSRVAVRFPGLNKWFRKGVAAALSDIKCAIQKEDELWARRFFWVALAETIRLTSNSRTSTFKLHLRPAAERERSCPPTKAVFLHILERNVTRLLEFRGQLAERNLLNRGRYTGNITLTLGDTSEVCPAALSQHKADMLITSPPYGDNLTTVSYGQHSFLPLQWIDAVDIDTRCDTSLLATTHALDSRSLGGSRRGVAGKHSALASRSPSFRRCFASLRDAPPDRRARLVSFCADLDCCLDRAVASTRVCGYMVWLLGNRCIGGQTVPLDAIVSELLSHKGATTVDSLRRAIPQKRNASRNTFARTMRTETILITRKHT